MENRYRDTLQKVAPLSKEEFAYITLREAILSGELKAGETLVQTQLAEKLGVSSIPIRTAIQRLVTEGLVTQDPHYPPKVSTISTDGLEEILLVRMHLETLASQEAIPHITPQIMDELEELVEAMDQALREEDMPTFGALNKQFHLKIYEACPYPLLKQMIQDLWDNSDRFRSRTMFGLVPNLASQSQEDHYRLLELIKSGDVEAAVDLMKAHKDRSRELFLQQLREED